MVAINLNAKIGIFVEKFRKVIEWVNETLDKFNIEKLKYALN